MKKFLLLYVLWLVSVCSYAQNDSCGLRISLLTCSPGSELYSTFGHTAIRVQEESTATDIVFNYGTFEFTPDFNIKFIRGKLLYSLSVENFADFLYTYQTEMRSVREQPLQLSCKEKQQLFSALLANAKPENRNYRYDFLFDNCTTRAGDIIARNTDSAIVFVDNLPNPHPTFRNMLHEYLDAGDQPWSKLGIDILLGAKLDRRVTLKESFFLPDYLMKAFDQAKKGNGQAVISNHSILQIPPPAKSSFSFGPGLIFSLLFGIVFLLSFFRIAFKALAIFDFLFFFIMGLAGVLLVFMWAGTDHVVCSNNYNLAWALPTHLVGAFFVHSSRNWVRIYFRLSFSLMMAVLLAWFFLPQNLNEALLPIVSIAALRSWFISSKKNKNEGGKTSK